MSRGTRVAQRLLEPVDIAWLAAFRFLFGLALCVSMLRFLAYGWVERLFVEPRFHFKYWGFGWVEVMSAGAMHTLFAVLAGLALSMALGFAFRLTATAFAVGLFYVQLIDVSTYLNHYYLAALLSVLLAISPANRAWSIDALLRRRLFGRKARPELLRAWLWLFRIQVGLVYFFAGMAKAQPDWLLHGQPLRIWLGANTHWPIIGPLFTIGATPLVLSWCGFLFDTTIAGFLCFRRTRIWAYLVVIGFHAMTRLLFPIGMFPVIMVLAALVFFDPDWPRTLWARLVRRRSTLGPAAAPVPLAPTPASSPGSGGFADSRELGASPRSLLWPVLGLTAGALYCLVQLALPLRYLGYGGNVLWHEQGMRFSWRVMVRAKGGNTSFVVRQPQTGRVWHVSPRAYLTALQESEMSSQPDLILQLAHHVRDDFERRGLGPVEVRVDSRVSLNGRRSAPFVDPSVDLVTVRDGLGRAAWVLPAPTQPPKHTRPVL